MLKLTSDSSITRNEAPHSLPKFLILVEPLSDLIFYYYTIMRVDVLHTVFNIYLTYTIALTSVIYNDIIPAHAPHRTCLPYA